MATTIWSGAISFGLVSVPVRLTSAVRSHTVRFHQVHAETGNRIRYRKVDEQSGEEVATGDIAKQWSAADGRTVVVDTAQLDALDPTRSELLDIIDFVRLDQIDPVFYDKPYNLLPQGEAAAKAYRLLVEVMQRTGKVAIASFVMRSRQYLAALRVRDGLLVLSTMHFADEVLDPSQMEGAELVARAEVREREVTMAEQLVESLTTDFDPTAYHDEHRERVLGFLEAEIAGDEPPTVDDDEGGLVLDLTRALEQSLGDGGSRRAGYTSMTKDELYDLASRRGISGRSSMSKDELVAALRAHDADDDAA